MAFNFSSGQSSFFHSWLVQQEYLQQLLTAVRTTERGRKGDKELKDLIDRVLQHYQSYYEEKARATGRGHVLYFFSPPWFGSVEKTFLWFAGWKPSMAFRIVNSVVGEGGSSDDQSCRLDQLRVEIRSEDSMLSEEMAKLQKTLAATSVLETARRAGRLWNGEVREEDSVMDALLASLEELMEGADLLRAKTVRKLVEILTPIQTVNFLAAAAQLHLRVRRFGMQMDAPSQAASLDPQHQSMRKEKVHP